MPGMQTAGGAGAAGAGPARVRRMPELAASTHSHSHTLHSALVSLDAVGVAPERIVLRRAGRDAKGSGTIVRQSPAAGTVLTGASLVYLEVAGLGFTQALPVGMWDSGGEKGAGTREILDALDDPLEKLKHWFHEGAPLFRIAPDDPAACARWLALFGVRAEDWPRALWYRLAGLVASLAQLSCSSAGCAFVLDVLLGLPVKRFGYHPSLTVLPGAMLSGLGARSSRLGVDLLMGDAVEDLAVQEIELGPVDLRTYELYAENEAGRALLRRVMELVMPVSTQWEVSWSVEDKARPPRLGVAGENSRLGINTHMGLALGAAQAGMKTVRTNEAAQETPGSTA